MRGNNERKSQDKAQELGERIRKQSHTRTHKFYHGLS